MPATEQTWRDTKAMHVVFGISSIVMFLCTLWLLAADHYRPWKDYQRKYQEIENWTLASRANEQETTDYSNTASRLAAAVDLAMIAKPSEEFKNQFVEQTKKYQAAGSSEADLADLEAAYKALIDAIGQIENSPPNDEQLELEAERIEPYRQEFFDRMDAIVSAVKFIEDGSAGERKFRLADVNKTKSEYDLAVRDQVSAETFGKIAKELSAAEADVAKLTNVYEAANLQRKALEGILKKLRADEEAARKLANEHQASLDQLQRTLAQRTAFGRGILEMPIIDAFGGPLRIQQIWLPDLTLNNNFRDVARFDRCTTCHLGIDKTAPGSAVLPGLPPLEEPQVVALKVPENLPDDRTTQTLYGFQLAAHGLIDRADVLVEFVWPRRAAAVAGLQRGDVITHVQVGDRNERLDGRSDALRYLVAQPPQGKTLKLTVQRGFAQPFSSHPRLDLFVGSMSPHKKQAMGCTICHEGQGSATSFEWASHTPNSPAEADRWQREHGWFDNHHWIFPMKPTRFQESNCLKCHHQVTELEPSERFPDPPAPTLVEGYKLVQYYGCFGCHEINGYDGPKRRVGPDIRTEPQYFAAAQQLAFELSEVAASEAGDEGAHNAGLESMRALAERVSYHPENQALRHRLVEQLQQEADRGAALKKLRADFGLTGKARELANKIKAAPNDLESRKQLAALIDEDQRQVPPTLKPASHRMANLILEPPRLSTNSLALLDLLKDVEVPGTMRKAGPSLRYVRSKLGKQTLASWIELPQNIRPTSKMPVFFGLHDHFKESETLVNDAIEREVIEIRAAAHYLYEGSQPFEYAAKDPQVTEAPDAERGKIQFETRGCLACHRHDGTPQGDADHGPNLSNLAKKINTADGKRWLRSWLLQPDRYHRRTKMPVTFLDPEPLLGDDGKPLPAAGSSSAAEDKPAYRMTDPAADIAEYLLGPDWQAEADDVEPLSTEQEKMLDKLALEYLKTAFAEKRAVEYLEKGIPERLRNSLKGAEVELVGGVDQHAKLTYVGRRTISKRGCAGCHDIPGFESAKPIGTTLADWGRKETSKLAFEHIVHYREHQHQHAQHDREHAKESGNGSHEKTKHGHGLDPASLDPDAGYYLASLLHHQREGFLRQKLEEPRSYDYKKVENKSYNDRLRMPQFPWAAGVVDEQERAERKHEEIESIMTFVLGLVAEPPAAQYIYKPDARREAIVQGEKVVQKFNCAGCHTLDLGRWDISYRPGEGGFDATDPPNVFPFLMPEFTTAEVYASKHVDWQGLLHGTVRGMQRIDADGNREQMVWDPEEEDYLPLEEYQEVYESDPPASAIAYSVDLWKPTYLDGHPFQVTDPLPAIPQSMVRNYYPPKGGDFARLMLPIAVELVRKTEPTADGTAAMAWVPPPLIGQGNKTQEAWLTEFLLQPYRIRPGVLLRMPKFNMSRAESAQLAQYFAARDNENYPSQFEARRNLADLAAAETRYQERLLAMGASGTRFDDALKIVINKAGCISCHSVNDQKPEGGARSNGPNLGDVYRRLQPSYMKRWIAQPSWILPYTKMQVVIPYRRDDPPIDGGYQLNALDADGEPKLDADGKPILIELYHGNSTEQLQAVVDLLSNFGLYTESQTSIRERAEQLNKELDSSP